jgi:uncharacterized membrane protein
MLIRTTATYASETWELKENMIIKLMIFERIMRKILSYITNSDIYQSHFNNIIYSAFRHIPVVILITSYIAQLVIYHLSF